MSPLPWMAGAIIQTLSDDADFAAAVGERIAGKTPSDASTLFVTVRTLTNTAISGRGKAWRMITHITAWIPPATPDSTEDPFLSVWRVAAMAADVFAQIEGRQQTWQGVFYAPRIVQGPTETVDDSRGPDSPMYGCSIQLELSVKTES